MLDSRVVLCDVHIVVLDPTKLIGFVFVDISNFFESINLDALRASLSRKVSQYYHGRLDAALFVDNVIGLLLSNKYVQHGNFLYKRVASLSTGDRIATDAANLHRDETFAYLLERYKQLSYFWGFVDDCGFIFQGQRTDLMRMCEDLQTTDAAQFRWEISISTEKMDFLDITIAKGGNFDSDGRLATTLYRKPGFKPLYLALGTQHNPAVHRSLYLSEANRIFVSNSTVEGYDRDLCNFKHYLAVRGLLSSAPVFRQFSADIRRNMLDKLRQRPLERPARSSLQDGTFFVVVPYSREIRQLRLPRRWKSFLTSISSVEPRAWTSRECSLRTAFTTCPNIFLTTYRYNFPRI